MHVCILGPAAPASVAPSIQRYYSSASFQHKALKKLRKCMETGSRWIKHILKLGESNTVSVWYIYKYGEHLFILNHHIVTVSGSNKKENINSASLLSDSPRHLASSWFHMSFHKGFSFVKSKLVTVSVLEKGDWQWCWVLHGECWSWLFVLSRFKSCVPFLSHSCDKKPAASCDRPTWAPSDFWM